MSTDCCNALDRLCLISRYVLNQTYDACLVHCKGNYSYDVLFTSIQQKNVHADAFVNYMCDNVLPVMDQVQTSDDGDVSLDLFKLFAELSSFCASINESRVERVFNKLVVSRNIFIEKIS